MKMRKSICIVLGLLMVTTFSALVVGDTEDVTTRWIVPGDTTITISYPNGETDIEFNAAGMNFTDLAATSQTSELAALRVNNDGNTGLEINASWTTEFPPGVKYVNLSMHDDTNTTRFSYGDTNETVNQTWNASLGLGDSNDFWFWTTGIEVEETEGTEKTLRIWSTSA